ncbi:hypothetical protein QN402_32145, partial [Pseudomonas sp. FG1]|nr:hypothetical protein [Pseudomonas sp. FG1]
ITKPRNSRRSQHTKTNHRLDPSTHSVTLLRPPNRSAGKLSGPLHLQHHNTDRQLVERGMFLKHGNRLKTLDSGPAA